MRRVTGAAPASPTYLVENVDAKRWAVVHRPTGLVARDGLRVLNDLSEEEAATFADRLNFRETFATDRHTRQIRPV